MEWQSDQDEFLLDPLDPATLDDIFDPLSFSDEFSDLLATADADVGEPRDSTFPVDELMSDVDTVADPSELQVDLEPDQEMDGGAQELEFVPTPVPGNDAVIEHPRLGLTEHLRFFRVQHNFATVDVLSVSDAIDSAFSAVVDPIRASVHDDDLVSVTIRHSDLSRGPIYLSFVRNSMFSSESFANRIFRVTQSNSSFLIDGELAVTVSVLRRPSGGAPAPISTVEDADRNATSLIRIVNRGNQGCGHYAIYLDHVRKQKLLKADLWMRMREMRYNDPERRANVEALIREVNESQQTDLSVDRELDLDGISAYARHLGMRVVVYVRCQGDSTRKATLLFKTDNIVEEEHLHIFLDLVRMNDGKQHFNLITKPNSFLGFRKYCYSCYSGTDRTHRCTAGCPGCNADVVCSETNATVRCDNCGHCCRGLACLAHHKQQMTCTSRWMCQLCNASMGSHKKKDHKCLSYLCKDCNQRFFKSPHFCFMRPLKKDDAKDVVMVSFDIESMFEKRQRNGREEEVHVPVHLCALVSCSQCYRPENVRKETNGVFEPLKTGDCNVCLEYKKVFRGRNCVKDFTEYLYQVLSPHVVHVSPEAVIRVFAHNFGRYDGRFILQDFFVSELESSSVIMTGNKILRFDVGNVRFQDSLNVFLSALRELPFTYKFDQRVKKGEFPYLFNTAENQDYVGAWPGLVYYGYEFKKPAEQVDLKRFHDTVKDRTDFNLQSEMESYCFADTEVLHIALHEFCAKFKSTVGFNPIQDYFTLPSMSFAAFRREFLTGPWVIGLTPNRGYSASSKQNSNIAKAWLDWIESQFPDHEFSREQKLGKRFADGFDHTTSTIYEFNGCVWHGCPVCFPDNRDVVLEVSNSTPNQSFAQLESKRAYYQQLRSVRPQLTLVEIWGHEFREQQQSNRQLKEFVDRRMNYYRELEAVGGGCDLREAYFGGRVNNFRFYADCADDEEVIINDFCSLYPAVLAKYEYMIGHPTVIRDNFDRFIDCDRFKEDVFGFVKCKVLPPKRMTLPILPARFNKRLEFVLCSACAFVNDSQFCMHSDEQRCLIGTFATPELRLALEHGYLVQVVYEILHWSTRSDCLFKDYVNRWIKLKQEASGYPEGASTEAEKQEFVDDYERQTGIKLDKSNVKKDPVLRNIAKIMLNSFYGKFAQRSNLESTEIVSTYKTMWELATDSKKEITGMVSVGTNKLLVNWKLADDDDARQGKVNVAIAAFVTAYARRELWCKLNEVESTLPGCLFYCDTDSIMYRCKSGQPLLQTGPLLGDLTLETRQDEVIKKAVFLGPKNYAYVIRNKDTGAERTVVKVKGITLNAKALQMLPFETLTEMAKAYCHDNLTIEKQIEQRRIKGMPNQEVINHSLVKVYRAVSEKRIVCGNETYPKGYVCEEGAVQQSEVNALIDFLAQ